MYSQQKITLVANKKNGYYSKNICSLIKEIRKIRLCFGKIVHRKAYHEFDVDANSEHIKWCIVVILKWQH